MKLTIHIKLIVSLAVVMAVRTPTAKAQKIVQPAPQCPVGAVGGVECTVVNSALTNFWQTCSLSYPLKLIKTSDLQKDASRQSIAEDSGIPVQIVSALNADPLKAPYQIPNTVSLPRLLTQIFTAADVTKIDLNDYIKEMSSASVSTLQQVGINWSIYTSNCQDSLAAALANNSGFTLSPVQLTATLKASGSTSTKSSLLVATGHFDSPFAVQSSDPNRFYLNMLLLRWRLDEATPSRSAFLLAHAHGASFSQLTSSQLDASLAATGGASAGFVVSSTNLSAQLSYDINSSSQGGFFNGVIDTPSSSDFIAVPSIADLQQAIQQQAFAVPSSPQKNVFAFEGDVIHITQTIVGIQGDICQSGGWQIHDASLPSPVPADTQEDWIAKSIRTAPSQSGAVPACTFDFDIAQGSSGKSQFSATPQLRGKIPSKTIGNFALTLNTLSLSDNPYPSFQSGAIASPDFSNAAKIQYQIPLVIVQGPTGSGYNRLDLAGTYAAQCNGNARTLKLQASTPGTPIQVQANNQTQVNLPLFVALVDAPGTPDPADSQPFTCTFSAGSLRLTDTAGVVQSVKPAIDSSLGLTFFFPHILPKLALLAPTCAAGKCDVVATVSGVTDKTTIVGKSLILMDGTKNIAVAAIDSSLKASFLQVAFSNTVAHNLTVNIAADSDLSAATSAIQTVPASPAPSTPPSQ